MSLAEFALIDRIRACTLERDDILLGIGDDAALLQPRANEQLVVTADTLNSGVHFPVETPAFDIGWKTLAVNLSDLAAMGARPACARWRCRCRKPLKTGSRPLPMASSPWPTSTTSRWSVATYARSAVAVGDRDGTGRAWPGPAARPRAGG